MSNLTASQLYIDFSGVSDIDPYTNASLTSVGGGVKVLSNVLKISNAGVYSCSVYVTATHTLSTVSAIAKVKYASDMQALILVNPSTGDGFALRGTGSLRIYTFTDWDIVTGDPLTFGSTTLADNDDYEIRYDGTTITAYKNDASQFTYATTTANLKVGWYYNVDDVNQGGARALGFNYAVAESVDTITASIQHGGSGTFTYTGLGTITAMTVHGVNVPTVSGTGGSGTFTMPARVDGATIAGHGSKTVVITGTLASASTTMIVAEAAAQQYVAITSLGAGVGALATYFAILTTDEITSDTPATLGVTTSNIGADTLIHTDYTGAQTLWWWKASNKVVTQITMINGVVTLGGLTRAGITGAITTSGITS